VESPGSIRTQPAIRGTDAGKGGGDKKEISGGGNVHGGDTALDGPPPREAVTITDIKNYSG